MVQARAKRGLEHPLPPVTCITVMAKLLAVSFIMRTTCFERPRHSVITRRDSTFSFDPEHSNDFEKIIFFVARVQNFLGNSYYDERGKLYRLATMGGGGVGRRGSITVPFI